MALTIPVIRGLVKVNDGDHYLHGQLGFALKDGPAPDYPCAIAELTKAIQIFAGTRRSAGWLFYEWNRALARVRQEKPKDTPVGRRDQAADRGRPVDVVPQPRAAGAGEGTIRTCPPGRPGTGSTWRPEGALLTPALRRSASRSMTQLTSQVAPPSVENACSQRQVVAVMSDHRKRTRIGRPSKVSSAMNVPMPSTKPPTTGGSSRPGVRPSSHQIDQRSDRGRRSAARSPGIRRRAARGRCRRCSGAVEDRRRGRRALELGPVVAAGEALHKPPMVDRPGPM